MVGDSGWALELEAALLTGCDFTALRTLCHNRPLPEHLRADAWQILLGVSNKPDPFQEWDDVFDLPEQPLIRDECANIVEKIGNVSSEGIGIQSDLESVMTLFSKTREIAFSPTNRWSDILQLLLALRLPKSQLYNTFHALTTKYVPRDTILEMGDEPAETIAQTIADCATGLEAEDIEDFCQLAAYFASRTPQSFRRDYHGPIFGCNLAEAFETVQVHSLLCLPVSPQELLQAHSNHHVGDSVHYLVIDARPAAQYNSGHLPGAFNLDASLQVNSPDEFNLAMDTLGAFKAKTHPNEHLCFMGSGREEEDSYMHMLISLFLKSNTQYISLARGGYEALHSMLKESLSTRLKSHSVRTCLACRNPVDFKGFPSSESKQAISDAIEENVAKGASFLSRFGGAAKSKASMFKGRVYDIVTNTNTTGGGGGSAQGSPKADNIKHLSPSNKKGASVKRSAYMFSLESDTDDDDDDGDDPGGVRERVKISTWLKNPEVLAQFPCHEINDKATAVPSFLLLTRTHLVLIRESEADEAFGYIRGKRALTTVVKITSKRRYPEILTFKYGRQMDSASGAEPTITGQDRLLIPKAGDAAKAVKAAIMELQEARTMAGKEGAAGSATPSPTKAGIPGVENGKEAKKKQPQGSTESTVTPNKDSPRRTSQSIKNGNEDAAAAVEPTTARVEAENETPQSSATKVVTRAEIEVRHEERQSTADKQPNNIDNNFSLDDDDDDDIVEETSKADAQTSDTVDTGPNNENGGEKTKGSSKENGAGDSDGWEHWE